MTFESRSHYEYGDPVLEQITRDEQHEHKLARARGEHVEHVARAVVDALHAHSLVTDPPAARVVAFNVLANWLYGNAALDIPRRSPKGCDHKFVDSNHCLKCGWSPTTEGDR